MSSRQASATLVSISLLDVLLHSGTASLFLGIYRGRRKTVVFVHFALQLHILLSVGQDHRRLCMLLVHCALLTGNLFKQHGRCFKVIFRPYLDRTTFLRVPRWILYNNLFQTLLRTLGTLNNSRAYCVSWGIEISSIPLSI